MGSAEALGRIGDEAAIPALKEALFDKSEAVRCAAIFALGRMTGRPDEIMPILEELIEDIYERSTSKKKPTADELVKRLRKLDRGFHVCPTAARAMAGFGDRAVPILTKHLKDRNDGLDQACAVSLGQIGPGAKPAVPALVRLLENEWIRVDVIDALEKIDDPRAIPALQRLTASKHKTIQDKAKHALESLSRSSE